MAILKHGDGKQEAVLHLRSYHRRAKAMLSSDTRFGMRARDCGRTSLPCYQVPWCIPSIRRDVCMVVIVCTHALAHGHQPAHIGVRPLLNVHLTKYHPSWKDGWAYSVTDCRSSVCNCCSPSQFCGYITLCTALDGICFLAFSVFWWSGV